MPKYLPKTHQLEFAVLSLRCLAKRKLKYLLAGLFLITTSTIFSQTPNLQDTLIISVQDTLYSDLSYLIVDKFGGDWYHKMKETAPDGYYKVYWDKKNNPIWEKRDTYFLYREGLLKDGHEKGNWIEYYPNGQIACIENWSKKGNSGKRIIYNSKGELLCKLRWLWGIRIRNKEFKKG